MLVKYQIRQALSETPRSFSKLDSMLHATESELYRISQFDLEALEFSILKEEIIKIRDEFSQEPWYQLGERIDWTNRESLLTTMVYYVTELNNLQQEILDLLIPRKRS